MPEKPQLNPEVADALFTEFAEELLLRLREGACPKCKRTKATPQELTVIRQFLSDNGITEHSRPGTVVHKLLSGKAPFPVVDPDAESPGQLKRERLIG